MLPAELQALARFHGHIGPYAVVGYRMGLVALDRLKPKKHSALKCIVKTGIKPPVSCLIDGIQFSSSCTLGKGNISVVDEGKAEAVFECVGKKLTIKLRDEMRKKIDAEMSHEKEEEQSMFYYNMAEKEFFEITLV
jgi:formylmethanofuran dehydrogenase subunit E